MSARVLALDSTGTELAIPLRIATGAEAVATQIRIALQTIRGTWLDDDRLGLPWPRLLAGRPQPVEVEALVREQLRRLPSVVAVRAVEVQRVGEDWSISVDVLAADPSASSGESLISVLGPGAPSVGAWYVIQHGGTA
jgi:hypothetical protein